ncbi:MAG: hypothetical protein ACRBFS_19475 [Aureispira sp.]
MDLNNQISSTYTVDNVQAVQAFVELKDVMVDIEGTSQSLDESLSSGFSNDKAVASLTDAITALGESIEEAKEETEGLNKTSKKNETQVKKNTKATNAFGRSLSVTGGKGRKFGKVLKLLAGTPLLATLTLVVGALAFLGKRFASTEDGANKLERITTVLSSVFGFLADKVIALGGEIIGVFQNPLQSIQEFQAYVNAKVVNLIKGLGNLFAGLGDIIISTFTVDPEGIEDGAQRMKDALSDIGDATGLTALPGIVAATTKEMSNLVEESIAVADAANAAKKSLQEVEARERSLAKSRAKLNTRLAETRAIASDTNKTLAERLEAIDEIEKAETRQLNSEISAQRKKISAIKKLNSLNKDGKDDLDKLTQAEVKLSDLQTQSIQRLITFQEKKKSLQKEAAEEVKRSLELERDVRLALIQDEEKRAIAAAKQENNLLKEKIKTTIKDKTTQKELLEGIEKQLQNNITAITEGASKQREAKRLEASNKVVQEQLLGIQVATQTKRFELQKKQELERQEFAQVQRSSEEIKAFKRSQAIEITKLELQAQLERLEAVRKFNAELTKEQKAQLDAEIALIKAQQEGVAVEIIKGQQRRRELLSKEAQAVIAGAAQALSSVSSAVKARESLLQKEVSNRESRISDLEGQLEKEKALAEQGKRNQVEQIELQIKEEKSARDKAQKEKEKAAKLAFILDTAVQTSNLITAISALYASFSTLPFGVGVALATALGAVMVGSFVASKATAASAAGFYKGGDTGTGNPREVSTRLGQRGYIYHKEEFVLPHQVYRKHGLKNMPVEYVDELIELGKRKKAEQQGNRSSDYSYNPFNEFNELVGQTSKTESKSSNYTTQRIKIEASNNNKAIESLLKQINNKPTIAVLPDGRIVNMSNGKTLVKRI